MAKKRIHEFIVRYNEETGKYWVFTQYGVGIPRHWLIEAAEWAEEWSDEEFWEALDMAEWRDDNRVENPQPLKGHKHRKGYVYCISYKLNGTPMLKFGRSLYETRVDSYNHMDNKMVEFNEPVFCSKCVEKAVLKAVSNGRNEYVPHDETLIEKARQLLH